MIKAYHTKIKNQEKNKSSINKRALNKKLHVVSLTKSERKICITILQCMENGKTKKNRVSFPTLNNYSVTLPNNYLAVINDCSTRTVKRSTKRLQDLGIIYKYQTDIYDKNTYVLAPDLRSDSTNENKIVAQNVPLKDIPSSLQSFFRNFFIYFKNLSSWTCVRAKNSPQQKGDTMNSVQKQLILDNQHDPNIKKVINNPKIKSEIITPAIEKLSKLLSLEEKESYKLVAFPEEALQYAFDYIEPIVLGKKVIYTTVLNKLEWVIDVAGRYCKKYAITPDWGWYYELCRMGGIDTCTEAKPLDIQKPKSKISPKKGIYSPWRNPTPPLSRQQLEKEVESCRIKLGEPSKYFKFCAEEGIKYTTKKLHECLAKLGELEEKNDENQSILHQGGAYKLENCSA